MVLANSCPSIMGSENVGFRWNVVLLRNPVDFIYEAISGSEKCILGMVNRLTTRLSSVIESW
jgi:hypothetical protein